MTWKITFIISDNEHLCLSCDVICSDNYMPASDMKIHPIRFLPTAAQTGTHLPPYTTPPLPSPLCGGLRADWQHLSFRLFPLSIRFCRPHPPNPHHLLLSLTVIVIPYYLFLLLNTHADTLEIHIKPNMGCIHTHMHAQAGPSSLMVIVCSLHHWQQNDLQAFLEFPFKWL